MTDTLTARCHTCDCHPCMCTVEDRLGPVNTDVQHDLLAWQAVREIDTTTPYDIEETDDQHRVIGICPDCGEPITDQDDEPDWASDLTGWNSYE